jgi:hypothetical protein
MSQSDNPIVYLSEDSLDRRPAVEALEKLLTDPNLMTPLVIGVYGGWGTGKTSIMRMLRRRLEKRPDSRRSGPEPFDQNVLTLWFDSWKYARQEQSLWRALLLAVIDALRDKLLSLPEFKGNAEKRKSIEQELEALTDSLYRSVTLKETGGVRVNWGAAFPLAADFALRWATAGVADALGDPDTHEGPLTRFAKFLKGDDAKEAMKLIEREQSERYLEHITSLEQFQDRFHKVLGSFEIGRDKPRRLYLFVDDLDRCLPEEAVAALEAIKLFLDLEGCVFILGMDRSVVEQGIRTRYKDFKDIVFNPRDYLDKIIQIPFTLPPLGNPQIGNYLAGLGAIAGLQFVQDCKQLIVAAAPINPRTLKRVLNLLQLTIFLDRLDPGKDKRRLGYLAKIILLQTCFDDAYLAITNNRIELAKLEKIARKQGAGNEVSLALLEEPKLQELLSMEPFFADLTDVECQELLTLSHITASL